VNVLAAVHDTGRATRSKNMNTTISGQARGVRKRSERTLWNLPLYDLAIGPDLANGETRGHARGIFAIGDIATGVIAIGGVARGLVAVGGLACGVVLAIGGAAIGGIALGGGAVGVIVIGGLAIGGLATGGIAIGAIAFGGVAIGYYAYGAIALGRFVSSVFREDPEAVQLMRRWLPWW
jgi:hypothetical protein